MIPLPSAMTDLARTPGFHRRSHWLALAVAAAATALQAWHLQPWTLDDAYISMRYADNFAAGHGLVYNPGSRVEGYTTFLWVLLLGAGSFLGCETEMLSKVLGALFALGCLVLVAHAHRFLRSADRRVSVVATLALGTCGVFSVWPLSGMEVAMTTFWVLLAVLLHHRSKDSPRGRTLALLSGSACALATMSRPDCALVFAMLGADRLLAAVRRREPGLLAFGLAFAALYAPYFAWRYDYYGWLLPNTFYAKVGGTWDQIARGLGYTGAFALVALPILLAALAALVRHREPSRRHGAIGALGGVCIAHTAYVIAVGGDVMPAFRFFTAILPLLCVLAGMAVAALRGGLARTAAVVAIVIANVLQFALHPKFELGTVGLDGKEVGLWMRAHYPPDTLLATNAAGGVAYFSRLPTIDMLGLADTHIAHREMPRMGQGVAGHEKGDGAYVLAARPDVIQFGSSTGRAHPVFVGDHEIAASPEFRARYRLETYAIRPGLTLRVFERIEPEGR
jgi:hypothetical protein